MMLRIIAVHHLNVHGDGDTDLIAITFCFDILLNDGCVLEGQGILRTMKRFTLKLK